MTSYAKKSGWSYAIPTALEAATAILMEYVETGKRLYLDEPRQYTRCQEKVDQGRWEVFVGDFSLKGLALYDPDSYFIGRGVGVVRKF